MKNLVQTLRSRGRLYTREYWSCPLSEFFEDVTSIRYRWGPPQIAQRQELCGGQTLPDRNMEERQRDGCRKKQVVKELPEIKRSSKIRSVSVM